MRNKNIFLYILQEIKISSFDATNETYLVSLFFADRARLRAGTRRISFSTRIVFVRKDEKFKGQGGEERRERVCLAELARAKINVNDEGYVGFLEESSIPRQSRANHHP